MTYNGWTNYPTWCVNQWLSNDEDTYDALVRMVAHTDGRNLPAHMKEFVELLLPELNPSLGSDLLGYAIDEVDWGELANTYHEDFLDSETLDDEDDVS